MIGSYVWERLFCSYRLTIPSRVQNPTTILNKSITLVIIQGLQSIVQFVEALFEYVTLYLLDDSIAHVYAKIHKKVKNQIVRRSCFRNKSP